MAAGLTAMMILLFLGNWRLTLIILATIPLSIITAVLVMYVGGQTLNTMTLGGFALAVGILVDNGTVVIENIERHVHDGEPLTRRHCRRRGRSRRADRRFRRSASASCSCRCSCCRARPNICSRRCRLSVCVSLIASLALSFTLVPVLFSFLMRSSVEAPTGRIGQARPSKRSRFNVFGAIHRGFEGGLRCGFATRYRNSVAFCVARSGVTSVFFILLMAVSLLLFPQLGRDFFPQVDAGQMRLHVRAPPASRIEETQRYFAEVETRHPPDRRSATRSTSSSTISACPTAASISR